MGSFSTRFPGTSASLRALRVTIVFPVAVVMLSGCAQSIPWEPYPRPSFELTLPEYFEQFHFDRMNGDIALYADPTRDERLRAQVRFAPSEFTGVGDLSHDMDPFQTRRITEFMICGPKYDEPGTDFCRIAVEDGYYVFRLSNHAAISSDERDALALEFWAALEAASAT